MGKRWGQKQRKKCLQPRLTGTRGQKILPLDLTHRLSILVPASSPVHEAASLTPLTTEGLDPLSIPGIILHLNLICLWQNPDSHPGLPLAPPLALLWLRPWIHPRLFLGFASHFARRSAPGSATRRSV